MNRMKKIGASILALALAASMLAGCGANNGGGNAGSSSAAAPASSSTEAKKEIKATDYVLAFHKYICTGDEKVARDVKMQEDAFKKLKEARGQMDNIEELVTASFDEETLKAMDKDLLTDLVSAFKGVLSRVEATATEESTSGDVVTVKISSDYIDFQTVMGSAIMGAVSGIDPNGGEAEIKKAMDKMLKAFSDGLYNYKFPSEKQTAKVQVKKSGETWQFVDLDKDGGAILSTIVKME